MTGGGLGGGCGPGYRAAMTATPVQTNWFDRGGGRYAAFRPNYPPKLAAHLAGLAPGHGLAVDVGCGTGQLTVQLAGHFDGVIGFDPSPAQLDHAAPHPRVTYRPASAEALPLPDARTDLIAAAQAAHWFDLPAFYAEVRRVARPGAIVALASYGAPRLDDAALSDRFDRFYHDGIGPFWPPERRLVDSGYADLDFPFDELPAPALAIRRDWPLDTFLGYLSTWSAIRQAQDAGQGDLLTDFADDLSRLWGAADRSRRVVWPVAMRIGRP